MSIPQVVVDTNVVIAGLRSRRGSAFQLLILIGTGQFDIHLSVPLVLEYTEVILRESPSLCLNIAFTGESWTKSLLALYLSGFWCRWRSRLV
jgi:predicted nucleic acid-binding protein